jgi:hypothetical protein
LFIFFLMFLTLCFLIVPIVLISIDLSSSLLTLLLTPLVFICFLRHVLVM